MVQEDGMSVAAVDEYWYLPSVPLAGQADVGDDGSKSFRMPMPMGE